MDLAESKLSESQVQIKKYLQEHRIEELFGDLLSTITVNQIENPLVFMVLSSLRTVSHSQGNSLPSSFCPPSPPRP